MKARLPVEEKGIVSTDKSYSKWVEKQMEQRIIEYSNLKEVSVFCGTWNVNARTECAMSDISSWILPPDSPFSDIYAIGLQEMVDLNVVNVMVNNHVSDEASAMWCQQLLSTLNARTGGVVENSSSMSVNIRDVRFAVTPTGVMGVLGNKGGIAIRMNIYDSPVCFVCAHLHAGRDNTYERNLDFQTILDTAVFPSGRNSIERPADIAIASSPIYKPCTTIDHCSSPDLQILTHEHVFWFGDLNYRIDEKLSKNEIFDTLATGEWESLKINDQLSLERAKGNSFQGFQEGTLCFPPTYKFQPGTDSYIDRDAKKPRAPAWCDRVLWRSAPISASAIQLKSYRCASKLNASDHKPVSAHFQCSFHDINLENMRTVYSNILFQVDKWINASTPKMAVEGRIIDFGTISFSQKNVALIKVKNTGTVMCEWLFVPKNDELFVSKPWLRLSPSDGILAPDETAEIEVSIDLRNEEKAVSIMSNHGYLLEDIVILRVVKGNDFFCMVNGVINATAAEEVRLSYHEKSEKKRRDAAALLAANKAAARRSNAAGNNHAVLEEGDLDDDYEGGEKPEIIARVQSAEQEIARVQSADMAMDNIYGSNDDQWK